MSFADFFLVLSLIYILGGFLGLISITIIMTYMAYCGKHSHEESPNLDHSDEIEMGEFMPIRNRG